MPPITPSPQSVIASMTPRQREIAALWWFDGLPQEEIAERLAITQQAVAKHLAATRRKLAAAGVAVPPDPTRARPKGLRIYLAGGYDEAELGPNVPTGLDDFLDAGGSVLL